MTVEQKLSWITFENPKFEFTGQYMVDKKLRPTHRIYTINLAQTPEQIEKIIADFMKFRDRGLPISLTYYSKSGSEEIFPVTAITADSGSVTYYLALTEDQANLIITQDIVIPPFSH